jgi:hypothetical protein
MGQLGELFPGAKMQRETPEEEGSGQGFQPGPLDLDGGVIRLARPASRPSESAAADPLASSDEAD